jgi:hypothetical protein
VRRRARAGSRNRRATRNAAAGRDRRCRAANAPCARHLHRAVERGRVTARPHQLGSDADAHRRAIVAGLVCRAARALRLRTGTSRPTVRPATDREVSRVDREVSWRRAVGPSVVRAGLTVMTGREPQKNAKREHPCLAHNMPSITRIICLRPSARKPALRQSCPARSYHLTLAE